MQQQFPLPELYPLEASIEEPFLKDRPKSIGEVQITYVEVREILTKATGFMDAYDFTLNPYGGCSFGCTYCYAAFFSRDIEKRDSWGKWVNVKENAVDLIRKRKPGTLDGKLVYMSSVTDPYTSPWSGSCNSPVASFRPWPIVATSPS